MTWLAGWSNRIKFEIDGSKINENLTDFPVLVTLDTTYSGIFNELGNNNKRLAFIDANSGESYYCEIENWDATTNSAQLWVRIPTLVSGVTTSFYMFFDNSAADNTAYIGDITTEPAKRVWDQHYVAVYHMSQDPSTGGACLLDSTNNGYHGTPQNMDSTALVDGLVGKALDFDGVNDYVNINQVLTNAIGDFTIEFVSKTNEAGSDHYSIAFSVHTSSDDNLLRIANNTSWRVHDLDGSSTDFDGTTTINDGNYHVTALVGSQSVANLYVDKNLDNSGARSVTFPAGGKCSIAQEYDPTNVTGDFFKGIIDEVRISNITRSEEWIKLTYDSLTDNLLTKSSIEKTPTGSLDYNNKIKLIIPADLVDNDLYNFPVLINLAADSGINHVNITDLFDELGFIYNRKKIAVTDHTGTGECFVEIESWDQGLKSAQLWVKVPVIYSAADTILYLYYDKDVPDNNMMIGDTGSYPAKNVWDQYFVAVYHMAQEPGGTGSVLDSTINGHHGTPWGNMTSSALTTGLVGKALTFDGNDDRINIGTVYEVNYAAIHVDIFTKLIDLTTTTTTNFTLLDNIDGANWYYRFYISTTLDGNVDNELAVSKLSNVSNTLYSKESAANVWTLASFSRPAAGTATLYQNGSLKATGDMSGDISQGADWFVGGSDANYGSHFCNGLISEVRISNTTRSSTWVYATNKTIRDSFLLVYPSIQTSWLQTYENGVLVPWKKRIQLDIDTTNLSSSLINFPVLINISNNSGINNQDVSGFFDELTYTPNTKLLIHSNNTDGDTTFIDETGINPITSNNVIHSTAQAKFGNSSFYYDGNSSYLSLPDNSVWAFSNNSFTIDFWVYPTSFSARRILFSKRSTQGTYGPLLLYINATTGSVVFRASAGISWDVSITSNINLTLNAWAHLAFVRDNNRFVLYINGAETASATNTVSLITNTADVTIGGDVTGLESHVGYIDEFRFFKNYARWTSNFTPPTQSGIFGFDWKKIAITDMDGVTQLPVEIDSWDQGIESAQFWTKVPALSNSEPKTIYLYYDKDKSDNINFVSETGLPAAQNVWDDNYVAVYHMNTQGDISDSTKNIITATNNGTVESRGLLGKARDFGTTTNQYYLDAGDNSLFEVSELTVECLVKFSSTAGNQLILTKRYEWTTAPYDSYAFDLTNSEVGFTINSDSAQDRITTNAPVLDTWVYYAGTYKTSTRMYTDGTLINTASNLNGSPILYGTAPFRMGSTDSSSDWMFSGLIDEVRISNIERSAAWIKTTNTSLKDGLVYYHAEEVYTPPAPFYYQGNVTELGNPVERKVFLYDRETGQLIDATLSVGGNYTLETPNNVQHFIVVLDDDEGIVYDPLISDRLLPNIR